MFSFRIGSRLGEGRAQTSITTYRTVGLGIILAGLALALFVSIPGASAAPNPFDITFPIPELGNCGSIDQCKTYCDSLDHAADCSVFAQKHGLASEEQVKRAEALPDQGPGGCNSESSCKTYCDDPGKAGECLSFAEEHDLISKEDIQKARVLATKTGPGGCRGEACRTYCDDAAHQDECFKFAEDNGLLGVREIEEVKKGREVLQRFGTGPGGCKSERECRTYCDSGDNVEECVAFGERAGFLSKDEAARLRGLAGSGPGGCRGKDQCQAYCDSAENAQECLTYAVEHNLISKEEGERARKIAGKTGPGGCRGESVCRAYCGDPAHGDECLAFAEENGFLPKEEIERARKFRSLASQAGPGGCQGEGACRAYCENPSNRDACFKFAGEQGLVPPEDIERFERGRSLEDRVKKEGGPGGCRDEASCAQFCSDSANSVGCLNFAVEYGGFSREEAQRSLDEFTRYREYSQTIRSRPDLFLAGPEAGQFGPPFPQGPGTGPTTIIIYQQGFPSPTGFGAPGTGYGGFSGPGSCSSPQACAQYCSTHESDCRNFYRSGEPQRQEFVSPAAAAVEFGPGGCRGLSECLRYCQDPGHRAECSSFGGTQGGLPTPAQFPGASGQFPGAPGAFPPSQDAPRFCPQIFEPVCGVNNVTYGNRCEAGYIPVSYNGVCRVGPQTGPLPGGCTTEECARQYCSGPSRSGVGECARFSSGQQQQTCPAGYRPVQTPQSGFYCAPETTPTQAASACVSSQTCEAVCYNASTPDYGTNACIAFRQSRPSPPSTGTCPQGQYWYVPPAGGSGYCLSNNTLPPPACPINQYWNGVSCVGTSASGCTSEATCSTVCYDSASPDYNSSACAGYRQSRSGTTTTPPGGGTYCDQALTNLLGSGCHYMYNDSSGNQVYCDSSMTRSAKRGDAATTPGCQSGGNTGTSSAGQREQIWNSSGLRSWIRSDADAARIEQLKQACANVPGGSNIWAPGAGTYSSSDFGMPDPAKCRLAASCAAGQTFDGAACVSGGTTYPGSGGGGSQTCDSALINLLGSGCHYMYSDSSGSSVFCDGPMSKSAKRGDSASQPGCQGGGGGTQYPGDASSCPGFAYSRWDNQGRRYCQLNSERRCDYNYPSYLTNGSNYTAGNCPTTDSGQTSCPSGQYWYVPPSGGAGYCQSSSSTTCPSGQYWNGTSCVSSTTTTCPSGQYWYVPPSGGPGYCQTSTSTTCPSGQYWNGTSCVPSTTTSSCPSGYHSMGSYCMSDSNSSTCQPLGGGGTYTCGGGTTSNTCPSGQYWYVPPSGGAGYCQTSTSTTCPSGQYWNGSACVNTSTTDCPSGQYWNGSSCVSSTTTTCPSDQYWNGSSCVSSTYTPPPTTTTCPSDQYWNGTSCVSSSYTPPPPQSLIGAVINAFANAFQLIFGR